MARYRGILQAAVALVLFLPAAERADAQDMLVIDSGGARWKSGDSREPPVTVHIGVVDTLPADGQVRALRRNIQRSRRYLTLVIPQPEPSAAPALPGRSERAAAPAAEARPDAAAAAAPVATLRPEAREPPEPKRPGPADAPSLRSSAETDETEPPPAPARISMPPARSPAPVSSKPPAPEVSDRPARTTASPGRRLPAGRTEATPALRAFLDRAAGTLTPSGPGTAANAPSSAMPARAKLPPPRPIEPRPDRASAASSSTAATGARDRFRLPPPVPATGGTARAAPSPVAARGLPPPPPETGTRGTGLLPPPSEPAAGASATPRRRLVVDAARRPAAAAAAEAAVLSQTFFYRSDGATLGAEDIARIGSLALTLAGETGPGIEIRAYSGSADGNGVEARRAALARAMEVRRLLIAAGVPETRIVTRAAGIGEGPAGRVDIVLVERS